MDVPKYTSFNINAPQVVSFTLINADTEQDIQTLVNGASLNLAILPTKNLNIRANTIPISVGRVVFALSGKQIRNSTDLTFPYALFDDVSGNYNAWVPAKGDYILNATPFTSSSGGTGGTALSINFSIINDLSVNQPPVSNAGPDKNITLPVNSVILNGSGSDPENGSNVSFFWSQVSGPSRATFSSKNVPNPTVSKLKVGNYVFSLVVKDQQKVSSAADQVSVTVNPATTTLVNYLLSSTPNSEGQFNLAVDRDVHISPPVDDLTLAAHPNPFGKIASVQFSVPTNEPRVILDVYDLKGSRIKRIYEGSANAYQLMKFEFDGSILSPGIFLLRLSTSKKLESIKLIMTE